MIKEKNNCLKIKVVRDNYNGYVPSNYKIFKWAKTSFLKNKISIVTIKLAKKKEIAELNKTYLKKSGECNILSFPINLKIDSGETILGDIIVCPAIINKESNLYSINKENRWAHMIIHSMLHLQGYTHFTKKNRLFMEKKEIKLMSSLGYSNPYYEN